MRELSQVCVFCGSSSGSNGRHAESARELGKHLANNGIGLVYGGGATGLMGIVADSVLEGGGRVTGIIPESLSREVAHPGLTELIVTETMHTRKALMYERSDAFVALAGGFGTLDELAEISTWRQLGIYDKPVGILNVDGYFDHLLAFFDRAATDGLLKPKNRRLVLDAASPGELIELLRNDDTAYEPKWESRGTPAAPADEKSTLR